MSFWIDFLEGNWLFIAIFRKNWSEQLFELKRSSLVFFSPFLLPGQTAAVVLCPAWSSLQTSSATALASHYGKKVAKTSSRRSWFLYKLFWLEEETLKVRVNWEFLSLQCWWLPWVSVLKLRAGVSIWGVHHSRAPGGPGKPSHAPSLLLEGWAVLPLDPCHSSSSSSSSGILPLSSCCSQSRCVVSFAFAGFLRGWALFVRAFQGDKRWHRPCIAN